MKHRGTFTFLRRCIVGVYCICYSSSLLHCIYILTIHIPSPTINRVTYSHPDARGWHLTSVLPLYMKSKLRRVLIRKQSSCCICSSTIELELDHIKPIAEGGTNGLANLQVLCRTCHRRKTNTSKRMTGSWIKVMLRGAMRRRGYKLEFIERYLRNLPAYSTIPNNRKFL